MIRKYAPGSVILAITLIAGCGGEKSTVMQDDQRDLTGGLENDAPGFYSGRAINGYLRNARVWLDLNRDGVLDPGEPTALTGSGGTFRLDVSALDVPLTEQTPSNPDRDPRDYPLMLVALPGLTVDESRMVNGNEMTALVDRGFFMMAPPGIQVITPFTTLVETQRRLMGFSTGTTLSAQVSQASLKVRTALSKNLNPLIDYVPDADPLTQLYARTFTRYLRLQTPDATNALLGSAGCGQGACQAFPSDAVTVISRDLLRRGGDLLAVADAAVAAAGDNAAAVNVEGLALEPSPLALDDPSVLVRRTLDVPTTNSLNTPPPEQDRRSAEKFRSAEYSYHYDTAGRLIMLDVDGAYQPSATWLAEVANRGGRIDGPLRQGGFDLVYQFNSALLVDGQIDVRVTFDWNAGRVTIDSRLPELGAQVDELDGLMDREYQLVRDANGRVGEVRGAEQIWQFAYDAMGNVQRLQVREAGGAVLTTQVFGAGEVCNAALEEGGVVKERITREALNNVYAGSDESAEPLMVERVQTDTSVDPSRIRYLQFRENEQNVRWHHLYDATTGLVSELQLEFINLAVASGCERAYDRDNSRRILATVKHEYQKLSEWLAP